MSQITDSPHPVSLTLIPPPPVTDKIDLEVRASYRNTAPAPLPLTFTFTFSLEGDGDTQTLHQETVMIEAGEAGGASFRFATAGHTGRNRICCAVSGEGVSAEVETEVQILASPNRSTDRLDGAWAGIYHWSEDEGRPWNADIREMTDSQWREMVRAMHGVGMDIIVVQELFRNQAYAGRHTMDADGYPGKAFYPSRLVAERMPVASHDPLEAILSEADALGMHVLPGVGLYAWFDFSPGSLAWHKAVVDELWGAYGHHPSLYGWYVSEEVCGNLGENDEMREQIVEFFHQFRPYCRRLAPDKPVMLASNCHDVPSAVDYYRRLLPNLDILCPFAFHRMPEGDLTGEEAAALLQRLCDEAGAHLWLDLEVFNFGPHMELLPRGIEGLVSDLRRFPVFEKVLCYQFPGLFSSPEMSRRPGGDATVQAFLEYKAFLETKRG